MSRFLIAGLYNCVNWTPSPSEIDEGQVFTQTGSCSQEQVRNWTYKSGAAIIETRSENKTLNNVSNTRQETGTKVIDTCLYNDTVGNQTYHTDIFWDTLYYNGVGYSKLGFVGSPPDLEGEGTQSNPFVIIPSGKRFYVGIIRSYVTSGYMGYYKYYKYSICPMD